MWLSWGNPECQKLGWEAVLDKWDCPQKEPPTPAHSPHPKWVEVGGSGKGTVGVFLHPTHSQ